jgi:hypothetical protein
VFDGLATNRNVPADRQDSRILKRTVLDLKAQKFRRSRQRLNRKQHGKAVVEPGDRRAVDDEDSLPYPGLSAQCHNAEFRPPQVIKALTVEGTLREDTRQES